MTSNKNIILIGSEKIKYLVIRFLSWFLIASKGRVLFLCFLISLISIHYSIKLNYPELINKTGVIISVLGFILSIKHSYTIHTSSLKGLVAKHFHWSPMADKFAHEDPEYINPAISSAFDELIGISLIIAGSVVSAFGSDILRIAADIISKSNC